MHFPVGQNAMFFGVSSLLPLAISRRIRTFTFESIAAYLLLNHPFRFYRRACTRTTTPRGGDAVRTMTLNSRAMFLAESGVRVISWMTISAVLGALGGVIFGLVFAGIGLALQAASWSVVNFAGYFALCGAAAGALVGGCGSLLGQDPSSEPAGGSPKIGGPVVDPIAVVPGFVPRQSRSCNRLAARPRVVRSPVETLASQNPSRN